MNVIVVDDERIVLTTETLAVKRVLPNAEVNSFQKVKEALEYAEHNKVDIAFLDINMKGTTGLLLAQKMQEFNPKINVIFCTGYSEYSLEALDLYCSGYLMKPVTDEKLYKALQNLRYPIEEKKEGLKVYCFGNFEATYNGKPIKFKQKKTKELLAFMIDRHGATLSTKEMVVALYEEGGQESFVRNLRSDLTATFANLGISDVIVHEGRNIGINIPKEDCDYYQYLAGNKALFKGEYMSQYAFAEDTLGWLLGENKQPRKT